MPVYDISLRQNGRVITMPLVAASKGEATLIAQRNGTVMGEPRQRIEGRGGGMTAAERYVFLHQLATMNLAKVPLSQGLKILRESHGGRIGKCSAQLEAGVATGRQIADLMRSEEHTSELQSLMRISYAVFCLKKQKTKINATKYNTNTRIQST